MTASELPIFVEWMEFSKWMLITVEKFPKRVRHTYSCRIENIIIDIAEDLTTARYSRAGQKLEILKACNIKLERLRILLRLCHEMKILSHSAHGHSNRRLYEIGGRVGGWIQQQREARDAGGGENAALRLPL